MNSLSLKSLVEDVDVKAVLDSLCSVLSAQSVSHVVKVLKWERELLVLLDLLPEFDKVSNSLAQHYSVVTFVSWNWRAICVQLGEARIRRESSTSTCSPSLVNVDNQTFGEESLQT